MWGKSLGELFRPRENTEKHLSMNQEAALTNPGSALILVLPDPPIIRVDSSVFIFK